MADSANDKADWDAAAPFRWATWPVASMLAFVALVHGAWWLFGDTVVHYGNLADSDGYARLLRVERLIETGDWLDSSLPGANAPYGGSLHWTRLFDVMLIALALPLMPLLGVKAALYWSGAMISPLLHLGTAATLAWAAMPLIGRAATLVAGGLTATQFGVLGYATIGHADHHMLLGLIAVAAFGFAVRALTGMQGEGRRHELAAGAMLAVGNWVGTEAQIPAALTILVVGLPWLRGEAGAGERSLALALGLFGGLALALLVERGPAAYFAVEYDRISVVHLTQAALVAAFWAVAASLRRRGREPQGMISRLLAAVGGAALALALLRLFFPRVLVNPLKDVDPLVLTIYDAISEYAPIADVAHFLLYLGMAVLALPWGITRLRRCWSGKGRWAWLLLMVSAAVYLALALSWIRWSLYAVLFLIPIVADLMISADAAIDRRFAPPKRLPIKLAAMVLLAVGPLAVGAAGVIASKPAEAAPPPPPLAGDPRPCPVQAMARFLEAPPWSEQTHTILASANFGAEILYRTRHRVTAIIHHRNAAGILDGVRILGGSDAITVRELIGKRRIDLILLCRGGADDAYFQMNKGDAVFYRRLKRGDLPQWLREVTLPADLKGRFQLFEVLPRS
ncbi:MAG: hypothetical protein HYW28_08260 [Rhodospirillales bacterium]|nr:hypothetical protein [Rhodospirillales bacterium]